MFGIFNLSNLLLNCIVTSAAMFVVFGVIYLFGGRRTYLFVSISYFLIGVGIYLFLMETKLPNILSLSSSYFLLIIGQLTLINVIIKIFDKPIRLKSQLISGAVFILLVLLLNNNKSALVCIHSLSSLGICTYAIYFTIKELNQYKNYNLILLQIANILFSIVLLIRIVNALFIEDIDIILRDAFVFKLFITSYNFYILANSISALQVNLSIYENENEKLSSENITSELAGIYNRRKFNMDFENGLFIDKFIAFIDIDNFKKINDCYGHLVGDKVISQFAKYISFDGIFTPYRISGDEFFIVSNDLEDIEQKENLLSNLNLKIDTGKDNPSLNVSASVGAIVNYETLNRPKDQIMKALDIAMYKAKHGKSKYVRIDITNPDYKNVFNSSLFAQAIVDNSTHKVIDVNSAYVDLFAGKDKNDFIGKPLDKSLSCMITLRKNKKDSGPYSKCYRADNNKFEVLTNNLSGDSMVLKAEYVSNGHDRRHETILSLKDISDKRKPFVLANKKASTLESIAASNNLVLWSSDYTQNPPVIWASNNAHDFFNVSQDEYGYIDYKEWSNYLEEMLGKQNFSEFKNQVILNKQAEIKFVDFTNKNGKIIKANFKFHSLEYDDEGNVTKVYGVCIDADKEYADRQLLKLRQDNLCNIFNNISSAVAIIDPRTGIVIDYNESHKKMYTVHAGSDLSGVTFAEYLPTYQDDGSLSSDYINKQMAKCIADGYAMFQFIYKQDPKKTLWMEAECSKTIIDDNPAIIITTKNITEQKELIENLKMTEQRYKIASKSAKLTAFRWVLSDDFLSFSNNTISIFDNQNNIYDFSNQIKHEIHKEDYKIFIHQIEQHTSGELDSFNTDVRLRINDQDDYRWFHIASKVIKKDEDGNAQVLAGVYMNINDHKENEARLVLKNNIDPLTGLYSANYLSEYISTLKDTHFSVIYIRLSGLRLFNDTYGYGFGDKYITEFSKFLCSLLNDFGICFRISGPEFVCVLTDSNSYSLVHNEMMHRIFDSKAGLYLETDGVRTKIEMNMGFVNYPGHAQNIDEIVKYAETSMLLSKSNINRNYTYFNRELYDMYIFQRQIVQEISVADIDAEFDMVFQPIIDITDNTIHNFEALIRWNHPKRGLMYPEDFIQPLETCGQILKVYPMMFIKVLKFIKSYHNTTSSLIPISFNLSSTTLRSMDCADTLIELAKKHDVNCEHLYFEVTEGLFSIDDHSVAENIRKLKKAGFKIIIDNFGVAYSSLHIISDISFDVLKIDKSYIDSLDDKKSNVIIQMAKSLADENKAITVFEGVETEEQLVTLKKLGFRYFQGFYLYRPMGKATILTLSE